MERTSQKGQQTLLLFSILGISAMNR